MATLDLGQVRPVYKGAWDSETTYIPHDWVTYDYDTWLTEIDTPAGNIPSLDSEYWIRLTIQGEKGDTGEQGAQGEQGIQGPAVSITSDIFDDDTIAISTAGVYGLKTSIEEYIARGAHFIGEWLSLRNSTPPTGYYVRNGALIVNASTTVPLLWAYLQESANTGQCITQTQWNTMQAETYTLATGTVVSKWNGVGGVPFYVLDVYANTLRLPDTRGMFSEDAGFDYLNVGGTHGDMIRNISGSVPVFSGNQTTNGALSLIYNDTTPSIFGTPAHLDRSLYLNVSNQVPTGSANKPRAFGMLPCIYAGLSS